MSEQLPPDEDLENLSFDELATLPSEQRLAILHAMQERSRREAEARRGRPLQPGDLSEVKKAIPTVTRLVSRRLPDGIVEHVDLPAEPVDPPARRQDARRPAHRQEDTP